MKRYRLICLLLCTVMTVSALVCGCSDIMSLNPFVSPTPVPTVEVTVEPTVTLPTPYPYSSDVYTDTEVIIDTIEKSAESGFYVDSIDKSSVSYILNRHYIAAMCEKDEKYKGILTDMYICMLTSQTTYEFPKNSDIVKEDMQLCMFALTEDCPELMSVESSYTYYMSGEIIQSVEFSYTMTPSELFDAIVATYDVLADWETEITTEFTDVVDIELAVHDKIIAACTYSLDAPHCSTAYGAVVLGQALCEGYSKSFLMMMQNLGIECMQVGGEASDPDTNKAELHAWNIVNILDEYYHVDVTWDDYNEENHDSSSYVYFNVSDEEIYVYREVSERYVTLGIPECTSTDMSYYMLYGNMIDEESELSPKEQIFLVLDELAKVVTTESGYNRTLGFKFTSQEEYDKCVSELLDWIEEWNESTKTFAVTEYSYVPHTVMKVIRIEFTFKRVGFAKRSQ